MKMMPNNIQVELVQGCNRKCKFCGIHAIGTKPIKRMSLDLVRQVAESLAEWGFNSKRVEFAMHGEPTLHHSVSTAIGLFRKHLPLSQLQLTTNGLTILSKGHTFVEEMFNAGLNVLIVDTYSKRDKILSVINKVNKKIRVIDYYKDTSFNPYHYHNHKDKTILVMGDLGEMDGQRAARKILNHAGNANPEVVPPINAPLQKKCSRPYRELVVHYDGTVPICCLDWRHENIIRKFPEDGSLKTIWGCYAFDVARWLLFNKVRNMRPCYKCDYNGGFRLGFLNVMYEQLNIVPNASEDKMLGQMISHMDFYKKFAHPNATDPLVYDKAKAGISKFFKGKN